MAGFPLILLATLLTVFCWGIYGPVLHEGQYLMGKSSLRPLMCVGLAYFVIAVLAPLFWLKLKGETGKWTFSGAIWSLAAGAAGAFGALGIILAFKNYGSAVYVMPLVFGSAPVVNTLVTMFMNRNLKEAGILFYVGVIVVALGAAGVLWFQPRATNVEITETNGRIKIVKKHVTAEGETAKPDEVWEEATLEELRNEPKFAGAYRDYLSVKGPGLYYGTLIALSISLTGLCWGSYGPVLHKGQMKMAGSRLRPLMCVGLAYFVIAVAAPGAILSTWGEKGAWNFNGAVFATAAGAAGAIGALGIILAFNFGGKPIFVMPLVFGGAPVINTLATMLEEGLIGRVGPGFFVSLAMVVGGAAMVLIFGPKPGKHPPTGHGTSGDSSGSGGSGSSGKSLLGN